jgi:AcrR family transcriptional regulator
MTSSATLSMWSRIFALVMASGSPSRARISIGSLYQYFPSKDAILVELLTRHLDAGTDAVRRLQGEGLPDSLEETIRVFVRTAIGNHLDDPELLRVMIEQAPRSRETGRRH